MIFKKPLILNMKYFTMTLSLGLLAYILFYIVNWLMTYKFYKDDISFAGVMTIICR
jgi:hypothetical protein